jgi:prepilin peptidase CpaA
VTSLTATFPDASVIGALVLGIAASISDIRTRRIPNTLTFGASAVALAFFLATEGVSGLGMSVAGWCVGFALFVPFFLLGGMGAGDVKLLAAFGAWLGPWLVAWAAAFGGIAGGVLAVIVALGHGYLRQAFRNLGSLLWHWSLVGVKPLPDLTLERAKGPRLAYALPITIGMVAALWLR